jgi:AraC-like DNA-binding protein
MTRVSRQRLPLRIARHQHAEPYVAVVLEGAYEEAGEAGRYRARAGDVLVHAPFSAHQDYLIARGARRATSVLNLPLPFAFAMRSLAGRIADTDLLVRIAERDALEAAQCLLEMLTPLERLHDAPDRVAHLLDDSSPTSVAECANDLGVSRATAFRWFKQAYGVAPARFRVESRARRAWQQIVATRRPLADIAAALGFADQAQMTRDVRALTGRTPGVWRRVPVLQHSFKSDCAVACSHTA